MAGSSREMDLDMPVTAGGFYSILDLACRNKKAGWWQRIEAKVFARGIGKMIHMYF